MDQGPHIIDRDDQILGLEKYLRLLAGQGGTFKIGFFVLGYDERQFGPNGILFRRGSIHEKHPKIQSPKIGLIASIG
jgi:hypothetical protein